MLMIGIAAPADLMAKVCIYQNAAVTASDAAHPAEADSGA